MSTLKYKATERYAMGWSDYRGVFKGTAVSVDTLHPPGHVTTDYTDVPTETLRNLWMARFGSRAVEKQHMYALKEEPMAEVAQELVNRMLVSVQTINRMEMDATLHYYVLEREHGNS